jgi:hypothetical protein
MEVPANIASFQRSDELIQSFPYRWHSFEHRAAICVRKLVLLQSENEMYKYGQHSLAVHWRMQSRIRMRLDYTN